MGTVFVGHDWAEAHDDVHIEDDQGRRLAKTSLGRGHRGGGPVPRVGGPLRRRAWSTEVVIATESDRGRFIGALVAAGYTVLAANPMSVGSGRIAVAPALRIPAASASTAGSPRPSTPT